MIQNLNRRAFMAFSSAPFAMLATSADAEPVQEFAEVPFVARMRKHPDIVALCYPATKITHAYCYVLNDFTTILSDGTRWCDGSAEGWRTLKPGQFDDRIIGRAVSFHIQQGNCWRTCSTAYLSG